ncbi:PD-(D/E)XK nuclease family protein [Halocella sp. SP3-1]|uniref:PD-(D/E)XK nuclease family protein n=1 Tax=Halocella sp. SP3-1 TaxID=2382161 RepID=UPI000F74D436|nr:PD-(D/E)XK nuclease family protein [Halocella sp. SP3-1]AZO94703.1 PD-(D/E)XK nuclease family protein [Halocella sp. SP3-1]
MKFSYLDYQEDLLARAVSSESPRVYVFDNFNNLLTARRYYQRPFLQEESIFLTMDDLKEKLFPTDRLILKEEKRSIFFYNLLTAEEKERLRIDNYFDVIDLAADFFKLYDEFNEYSISEIEEKIKLQDWQLEKYRILRQLRERYLSKMEDSNYTDQTLVFDFQNFDPAYFTAYREFILVNIINFTPGEKRLLAELEAAGKSVHLYLQIKWEDYNEENLQLNKLSLPEEIETEVKLYHSEEDLLQVANLLCYRELAYHGNQSLTVLDAAYNDSDYQRLLSSNRVKVKREISFIETKIYKFLESLYSILSTADLSHGFLKLEIKELLEACYFPEFCAHYRIDSNSLAALKGLAAEDYVYLTEDLIESNYHEDLAVFKLIFAEMRKIFTAKGLRELCSILEEIDFSILDDELFTDNITQYFDGLLELSSIEEIGLVDSWVNYFNSIPQGLFLLTINYLKFKKVILLDNKEKPLLEIEDLLSASHSRREELIITNASRGIIPSRTGGGFLLTEKQRAELGLPTNEERALRDKYYFFRHLFSSQRAVIYSLQNQDTNLTTSSFIEEIRLAYGLEINNLPITAWDYPTLIRSIFINEDDVLLKKLSARNRERDKLLIEEVDFPDDSYYLSYYKYQVLKDCFYKFYLSCIAQLEDEQFVFKKELSPRLLGIIVHEVFDKLITASSLANPPAIEEIRGIIEEKMAIYDLKINDYYKKYYEKILVGKIQDSIIYFFKVMGRRVNSNIRNIKTEWQIGGSENTPFFKGDSFSLYLRGRIDLLLEFDDRKQIIDFKTGGSSLDQLDFYSLLLDEQSGSQVQVEKGIYSLMDERYLRGYPGGEMELADEITNNAKNLTASEEYKASYKARCKDCIYLDICRVVIR